MARFILEATGKGGLIHDVDPVLEAPAEDNRQQAAGARSRARLARARPRDLIKPPPRARVWHHLFLAEIERLRALEPGWGRLDCVTLPRDMVVALTGADASLWPSGWTDEASARRVMARHGFADVGAVLAAALPEIAPSFARAGDVGVIEGPDGITGCVVIGETLAVVRASGLDLRCSRQQLKRAFRV